MEQLENTSYDNGNIISEDEANDIYYISSLKKQYGSMSMPQVDNFDASGNKEPTLGEKIKEGVSAVGTSLNEQQGTLSKIGEDTTKGMIKGADKGITQTLKGVANLAGQPVDIVNEYAVKPALEYLGIEGSDNPFMGTKMTTGLMDSFISMTNKVFPKLISDPINESLNEPFNNETYGKLIEGISQFGITAVPAAKLVSMMSSANPFVRGMAWGGIADYMSMNPEDPTATEMLLTWWQGADPKERSDWANNAIAVVQKNDTDGEATKRLKNMLDGALIGGGAEGLIQGILKASTMVPWKQLLETVTPAAAGGVTFSDDAEGSVFTPLVKAAAKESPLIVKKKSLNNVSNLSRAKKLGFDVDNPVYHGTNANELTEFKESTIGSATDQGFFGKGFYFASNPGEAGYYGKNVGKYVVRGKLLDLNNKSGDYTLGGVVKFVDWAEKLDKIDMLDVDTKAGLKGAKKLIKYFNENIEYGIGQNADGTDGVFATIVNPTRKVDVYKGKEYPVTINSIVDARGNFPKTKEEAREQLLNNFAYDMRQSNYKDIDFFKGWNNDFYDSLSDYIREGGKGSAELTKKAKAAGYDGIKAADETVIFDPKNIRSIDAKFDPSKTNSPDLMSSYSKQNNSQMS